MEFQNRTPQYPGRIRLTPVSGASNEYILELADGSTTGTYKAGTPLNAETLNSLQSELLEAINSSKIKSIKISDGTYNGSTCYIGENQDLTVRLPSTINATLNGKATSAESASNSYGSVIFKTVSLSTSYTTVYNSSSYSSFVIIIAPWSGNAQNTAIFAATYANGAKTSIDNLSYCNKDGWTDKQWSGSNFQVKMSSGSAAGVYSITIIDAHY